MPRNRAQNNQQVRSRHMLPALIALSVAIVTPQMAQASCSVPVAKDAAATAVSLGKSVAAAGTLISEAFVDLNDSLTRLANQLSNTLQEDIKAQTSLNDRLSVQATSDATGQARASIASEFVPSRVVCGIVSNQQRMNATRVSYEAYRTVLQNQNTAYSNNAPGSGAEKGMLQAMSTAFTQRCSKYANAATMNIPASMAGMCNAAAVPADMRDLDIQPWKALLDPVSFTTTARQQAAVDSIKMLTELAPPDPIRGNVLLRNEGQSLHVLRMRDVTRMNLARGVLEDMVALRTADPAGGATATSRLASYIELITGRKFDPATNSLSGQLPIVMAAEEPKNAAGQEISARLATQQALIFELLRLGEQITALEATELAIKVERSRGGNASVSSRPINN